VGWSPYDSTASSIIEMYYEVFCELDVEGGTHQKLDATSCTLNTNGFTYTIDLERMTQTNSTTNRTRKIRRATSGTARVSDSADNGAARCALGIQRPLDEVKEWKGYPSRQCCHPGCQVRMSVALMDFHEVLCDRLCDNTEDESENELTSIINVSNMEAAGAAVADSAGIATAASTSDLTASSSAEEVVLEATVAAATESVAKVVTDTVADEMVIDVLGELLMGLHGSLFGTEEPVEPTNEVDVEQLAAPKFKSVKKRVGGGFMYVQVPDDGSDDIQEETQQVGSSRLDEAVTGAQGSTRSAPVRRRSSKKEPARRRGEPESSNNGKAPAAAQTSGAPRRRSSGTMPGAGPGGTTAQGAARRGVVRGRAPR